MALQDALNTEDDSNVQSAFLTPIRNINEIPG